jgi:hypothetical protein
MTVSSRSNRTIRSAPARMGAPARPAEAGTGKRPHQADGHYSEGKARKKIPSVDGARTPLNNRPMPPRRSRSMSLIEFGPATMPDTSAGTSTLGLAPWSPDTVTWHVASPANPARAARATSGANPAHDTRFRRKPKHLSREQRKQEDTSLRYRVMGARKSKPKPRAQ